MAAATYNILIEQGSVFKLDLIYKDANDAPIDLTGYEARMQVRQRYSSSNALISLSTTDGTITLGGAAGTIHAEAVADVTKALTIKQGVYDLELVPPAGADEAFRLVQGVVIVTPEVTR